MASFLTIIGYIFGIMIYGSFLLVIAAIFIVGTGADKSNDDYCQ